MVHYSEQPKISFPNLDLFTFFSKREGYPFPKDKVILASTDQRDRSYTLNQVLDQAKCFSHILQKHLNFQPGQVVAFVTPNDIDMAPLLFGTWHAGGTVTAMNPNFTTPEISMQLKDCHAKIVIAHPTTMKHVADAATMLGLPTENVLILGAETDVDQFRHWRTMESASDEQRSPQVTITDPKTMPAFIPYSSGTTGMPKGIVLSHQNMTSNILQCVQQYKDYFTWNGGPNNSLANVTPAPEYHHDTGEGGDRLLSALPLFHLYGLVFELLMPLWMGTTSFIATRYQTLHFAHSIKTFKITKVLVVPPILMWLLQDMESLNVQLGQDWFKSVRMCITGAAPLGSSLACQTWQRLGWRVISCYGMSEVGPVILQDLSDWQERPAHVGKLISGVEAKIIKLDGTHAEVGEGEEGELVLKGPNVFLGYFKNITATKDCLNEDGWFRTGDMGYFRDQNLFITDRIKDMIKYRGFPVAPAEVEAVLLDCPLVADVAVVGVHHAAEGSEVPRAYCVHVGGLSRVQEGDADIVIQWAQARLAKHKWVRGGVFWLQTIPKSVTGKILRRQMRVA